MLYDILTPKFNLWIYVGVMECRTLFSVTVTLTSVVVKLHPQHISDIILGRSSKSGMCIHIGPRSVTNYFRVTVTLTSGFSSSQVEPRAYLYIIWGRNPKFGVGIHFGVLACRLYFWVTLTLTSGMGLRTKTVHRQDNPPTWFLKIFYWQNSINIVSGTWLLYYMTY